MLEAALFRDMQASKAILLNTHETNRVTFSLNDPSMHMTLASMYRVL